MKFRIKRLNSIRGCDTVCHASCVDGAEESHRLLDSVMLSFTGSDVAACQCGEQGGGVVAEMALHTFLNALSVSSRVSCGFQHCVSPAAESVL